MELLEYEAAVEVKKSTNKTVAEIEEIKAMLAEQGVVKESVFASLDKRIEVASKKFIISDGITKSFQSLLIESLVFRLRHDKSMKHPKIADALNGAKESIIKYGAKRAETKAEKAERVGKEGDDEEELEE